jgi:hypothetical protein
MEKVQSKLKDSIDKQTLKSLDRLTDTLDTRAEDSAMLEGGDDDDDDNDNNTSPAIDASETTTTEQPVDTRGENKVRISKRSKRQQKHGYRMKAIVSERKHAPATAAEKRKPRFHCAF